LDHRVGRLDVDIEFVERDAAEILKILLDFDLDVVACEMR
jgi:hypothetical protein